MKTQVAVKTCVCDRLALPSALVLHGRNGRVLPYGLLTPFMKALQDLSDTLTRSTASIRPRGGCAGRRRLELPQPKQSVARGALFLPQGEVSEHRVERPVPRCICG